MRAIPEEFHLTPRGAFYQKQVLATPLKFDLLCVETRLRVTFALLEWGDSKALSLFSFSRDEQAGNAPDSEAPLNPIRKPDGRGRGLCGPAFAPFPRCRRALC